jgi:isoleucyl-tRNA synthetase
MASTPLFDKVPSELDFPKEEREVLALWKERRIFERSLEEKDPKQPAPTFVFYEGPPTANGMPHNGHVLTRVMKDLFPRYRTMQGYRVPRKAGWDTHGLPVEVEVEKSLRIHGKAAIEEYGIEPFVRDCIQSVFTYTEEWARLTERVGFWVNLEEAYVTYHKSYVESVWWALSELFKKGLLYQGHKVVWWWAQGGTALSSGEVGEGYRQVDDPSAYVAFPLEEPVLGQKARLLVWTTTPWTLPSNMFAAVHPNGNYVVVGHDHGNLVVAKALVEELKKKLKADLPVLGELKGQELLGRGYTPPFAFFGTDPGKAKKKGGGEARLRWRVIGADFVTFDTGTGIVHTAPAFGEDDFNAWRKDVVELANPDDSEMLCAVKPDGTFDERAGKYAGRWVKDADKDILHELKDRGLLVHTETYRHDYPFCPRADQDALIQYARPAWYIRTTALIDKAKENNQAVQWLPPHIKDGRFGDFLANNVDWALSRERYWGTPLNVWVNDVTGAMEAPASVDEILKKNPKAFDHFHGAKKEDPALSEHLMVHKPWIDAVTWENPGEPGVYRRVPEVIDCWFDSGCMPFAQWGFPHQGQKQFKEAFPADFISEAIDQTRGWFYSLLMVSTLVFDEATMAKFGLGKVPYPHPYKTCIVLGHVSDKEGRKESKSKGNYTPPEVILDRVQLDFAVVDPKQAGVDEPDDRTLLVSQEDLDGLDLLPGAPVKVRRGGAPHHDDPTFLVQRGKKLKRRTLVLSAAARERLGLELAARPDPKPSSVASLPPNQRLTVWDFQTPAPGADAFRWFFYASNPPWSNTRHSLSNVRALQKDFLVKLRNVWGFFAIYANIDGFDAYGPKANEAPAFAARPELDRWILGELAILSKDVAIKMDAFDVYGASQSLGAFVEALSNWYVRRCRERFWRSGWDTDKHAAYATLHECLVTMATLAAPFVPFMAERMWQGLVFKPAKAVGVTMPESVHLARFPKADESRIDAQLSERMRLARDVVSLGLQVRTSHKLKVRQPLRKAHLIVAKPSIAEALGQCLSLVQDELNVMGVHFVPRSEVGQYVDYSLKPNFRSLGARGLGREAQALKKSLGALAADKAAQLHGQLLDGEKVVFDGVELVPDDIEVAFSTKPGFAAAGDRLGVVVLETTLDPELLELGFHRELLNRVQTERKDKGLEYTDRVALAFRGSARLAANVKHYEKELATQVLASGPITVDVTSPETLAQARDKALAEGWKEAEVEGEALLFRVAKV